ncbi:hypothetical protein BDV95DRAFT_611017 [Massariosphaeria phaeospora]|uniref:DUF7587 domain-containing protein n=1 Tax=Massariosphaeria phaeospora TaxID=100035 RepID=A0A7C8I1X9_9PLEO|nr:hypothetical protein BDV95DRAFT_611017 [Massariosphaeria phaeospora]
MEQENETPTATVFQPQGSFEDLVEHFDSIPHYLFRTSSPQSAGNTTETYIESEAVKLNLDQRDLLRLDRAKAVAMLRNHLLWSKNHRSDNLISWTSSFLFAVQHGIRRQATGHPYQEFSEIKISILDTRKVPRGTFLPAVALLNAYGFKSQGRLAHKYYCGEYLSQGRLDLGGERGIMETTTLESFINHGLFELYPPFADKNYETLLCSRVLQLREVFRSPPEVPNSEEISLAQSISVGCFLDMSMRPVVMMTLLSLKPRFRLDTAILAAFRDNCWGTFVADHSLDCYKATSDQVPEHKQLTDMMHDVHADTQRKRQLDRTRAQWLKEKGTDLCQIEALADSIAMRPTFQKKYVVLVGRKGEEDYDSCG